jgi:hypothetical protein
MLINYARNIVCKFELTKYFDGLNCEGYASQINLTKVNVVMLIISNSQ